MSITSITDMSLDKRIAEIKKEAKNNKYAYEYYVDEYCSLIDLKAKIKKERNNDQTICRK